MLPIFDGLRDVTLASVTIRMLLPVLCGVRIGNERAYNRRPPGFRPPPPRAGPPPPRSTT